NVTVRGAIIDFQGNMKTENLVLFDHYDNYSSHSRYQVSDTSESFLVVSKSSHNLTWKKFSKVKGVAKQISNGNVMSPRNGFIFHSYSVFATIDGQHAIVYKISKNTNRTFYDPVYEIYIHFIKKTDTDQQLEQILLYKTYDSSILPVGPINCQA
ncbi:14923_t:CDS:2, partial [Dentiscutata heterogama]